MNGFNLLFLISAVYLTSKVKCGSSSISLGPPVVHTEPGNHTVSVGDDFQFYCKIRANPLAHVAMKRNPINRPVSVRFPRYGSSPTGGNTIVLLDLMGLNENDEGRYTCFAENKYGSVMSHGWLKFVKECSCHAYGVLDQTKQCDDDGKCICRENVGGEKCDKCAEGFFNFPFCMPCDCNPYGTVGGSASCDQYTGECNCLPERAVFDPQKCDGCPDGEYFNVVNMKCSPCKCNKKGSETTQCNFFTGQCDCKESFYGDKCDQCKDGYYDRANGCLPCDCVPDNTYNYDTRCDAVSGQCNCKASIATFTDSRRCASCPDNTFYNSASGQCQDCGCNPMGTKTCTSSGVCECRENFTGISCDQCEPRHYGFDFGFCEPCECNKYGTIAGSEQCDTQGNCPCKTGFSRYQARKCDGCPQDKYMSLNSIDECQDCDCHPKGSLETQCALYDGQCPCKDNIGGRKCDECEDGAYGLVAFGECLPCNCDPSGSRSQSCDKNTGQCPCYQNFIFTDKRTCGGCPAGQYNIEGTCEPCNCNTWGSISMQCDSIGKCACQPTVQALKCDECKPGFYNFQPGGCDYCNCNEWGVADNDTVCNPVTGQCNCKAGQSQISSRTCDGCPPGYYADVNNPLQCFSCNCHPYGSTDTGCNLYTGSCDCGPNVKGDKCDECEEGFYGLNTLGECIPCQCDPEGSSTHTCNAFNGQCECKAGYGTIDPRTCEGCPSGMYLQDGICVPCGCNPEGSYSNLCTADGSCFCTDNVLSTPGGKCDQCEPNYYFGPSGAGCEPCGCDRTGTIDGSMDCDSNSGQCSCLEISSMFFLDPRRCEPCSPYQWNFNAECSDCGCNPYGSSSLQCDFYTGQCPCVEGAYGISCDSCMDGYFDLEQGCLPCNCDKSNTVNGEATCDMFGQCRCQAGLVYTDPVKCATCGEGTFQDNGQCSDCDCNLSGSVNGSCDSTTGQCLCMENLMGRRCDQCEETTFGVNSFQGCKPCNCNINGTIGRSQSCDQVTGQCNCLDGQTKYESRTCDGCLNNFFVNEYLDPETKTCKPCNCLDAGSRQFNCSLYEGVCDCNPGIIGNKCEINPDAQGDTVVEGDMATLSCALQDGVADKSEWIGEDCAGNECGIAIEDPVFMSLSYIPQEDATFTCNFNFGDIVLSRYPDVDVISFDITSLRVQSGSEVTLTAIIDKMNEEPHNSVTWKRSDGKKCSLKKCELQGHAVDEETIVQGKGTSYYEATQISKLNIGTVTSTTSVIYYASYRYRHKTFKKTAVVSVYECNCDPVGSKSEKCDPMTLQCPCKASFTGQQCTKCKDKFYSPAALCKPCDCDGDNSKNGVCDKSTGQCECRKGSYIDTRRCEACPEGEYIADGACAPCGCVTANTVLSDPGCNNGQCNCVTGEEYINSVTCEMCPDGYIIEEGECVEEIDPITFCDCYVQGSKDLYCDLTSLQCKCKDNYEGLKCDSCKAEYYGPELGCKACVCDPDNSFSAVCDGNTGQCDCNAKKGPFVDPQRCGACADDKILKDGACELCPEGSFVKNNVCKYCKEGLYRLSGACVDCECDPDGSRTKVCDKVSGVCPCNPHYFGDKCMTCDEGYYDPKDSCKACECDPDNSWNAVCDQETGQCLCNPSKGPFVDMRSCESCPFRHVVGDAECVECEKGTFISKNKCTYCREGQYLEDLTQVTDTCTDCGCDPDGSESNVCNRVSGKCECQDGYEGTKCNDCQVGYFRSGSKCVECVCASKHSASGVCEVNGGQCECVGDRPYIKTRTCTPCNEGLVIQDGACQMCAKGTFIKDYQCEDCLCSVEGTSKCNPKTGACSCKPNYVGDLCDACEDGFYGYPNCRPCKCSSDTVSGVCNKDNGQCECNQHFEGRTCEQCQDGYYGAECAVCECTPTALSTVCDKASGQCVCPEDLFYKDDMRCAVCPYNHRAEPGQCVPCERGEELINNVCTPCTEGMYEVSGKCTECPCSVAGTRRCDKVSGQCECSALFTGDLCGDCVAEYYSSNGGCAECACDPANSADNECASHGQCACIDNKYLLNARTCEKCPADQYLSLFVATPTTKQANRGICMSCDEGYFVEDNACRTCDEGKYLKFGKCDDCRCNPIGSLSSICNPINGICECGEKHQGEKCQSCKVGYYSEGMSMDCKECGCFTKNTLGADGDRKGMVECDYSGQCYCQNGITFVDDRTCETCPAGQIVKDGECQYCPDGSFFSSGTCQPCGCDPEGSLSNNCAKMSGVCQCNAGYKGDKCDQCEAGFYKLDGKCVACACYSKNSESDVCNPVGGQCPCVSGATYDFPRTCFNCPDGKFFDKASGECQACRCYIPGSQSEKCDRDGNCGCQPNVLGQKCDQCRPSFYFDGANGCVPCNCNRYGVLYTYDFITPAADMSCDMYTGQCNCISSQKKYASKRCDGCPSQQWLGDPADRSQCIPCACHPEGSKSFDCGLYDGQCDCNPQIVGDKCDTRGCEWGVWVYGRCSVTCGISGKDGSRERSRTQHPSAGGDFTTIVKVAVCEEVQTETKPCRLRPCKPKKRSG